MFYKSNTLTADIFARENKKIYILLIGFLP